MTHTIPIVSKNPFEKCRSMSEITVMYNSDCNLHCGFCINKCNNVNTHQHLTKQLIQARQEQIENVINLCNYPNISLTILGGELFQDKYGNDVIDHLTQSLTHLQHYAIQQGKKITYTVMTNIITKHIDRIINLVKAINGSCHPSYDFVGRFENPKLIDLWFKNYNMLISSQIDNHIVINGHRANIEFVLNDDIQWKKIYNIGPTYFTNFENVGDPLYDVNDVDVISLYKHLSLHYPLVDNIIKIKESLHSKMGSNCLNAISIDNTIHYSCCDKSSVIKKYLFNKKCFQCDFLDNCILECPRLYNNYSSCFLKEAYTILSKHHGIN